MKIKNPEIDQSICSHLIFNKAIKQFNGQKSLFQKLGWNTEYPCFKINNSDFTQHINIQMR